jgi:hypothetical protein
MFAGAAFELDAPLEDDAAAAAAARALLEKKFDISDYISM